MVFYVAVTVSRVFVYIYTKEDVRTSNLNCLHNVIFILSIGRYIYVSILEKPFNELCSKHF